MCNLYRHETSPADLKDISVSLGIELSEEARRANIEPSYVGADNDGPVLAVENGTLVLRKRRWGFPPVGNNTDPITNIRRLDSPWWQRVNRTFLCEKEHRCLIPFSDFAEWDSRTKSNAWFSIESPTPCFAGIWRPWRGERLKAVEGKKRRQRLVDDFELFAFLTTEPCPTVAEVHPKAMPVILTTSDERARWLSGGMVTLDLQRPLDDELVKRVK
jgi:putative SOS response-associated peptidase YedK